MLRAGCIVLSIWLILNVIPSCMILVATLTQQGHTPAIYGLLDESDIENLSSDTVATIDSIAVFANGLNLAFCSLAIAVIWIGLHRGHRWAFWSLAIGFAFALLAGAGGDYMVGTLFPQLNMISFGIIVIGLTLAARSLFGRRSITAPT